MKETPRDVPLNSEAVEVEQILNLLCKAEKKLAALQLVATTWGANDIAVRYEMPDGSPGIFTQKITLDDLEEVADQVNDAMLALSRFTPTGT